MKRLDDFIKVYDGVLSAHTCELLSLTFEMSRHTKSVHNKIINFTELNLNEQHPSLIPSLVSSTREVIKMYQNDVEETKYFPLNTLALEEFRIKCYKKNTDEQFKKHVDVGDHNSSRRYLAFLYYLNTITNGGSTSFEGFNVRPKRGSVLVFPPTWMYPHSGHRTLSDNKFIMSTYLHYT